MKQPISIQPEDILTPKEVKVLQLADRGELPCPRCGQPLKGNKVIEVGIYEGVVLVCLEGCGFREI